MHNCFSCPLFSFLQGRIPPSLGHSICTVNILALKFSGPDLKAILGVLSCFPCLEKLYVIWDIYLKAKMKNLHQYDPLNPVKCLESHLKVLVLKNYTGGEEEVGFAKFFVFNARVVKEINFAVCDRIAIDKNWMTDQLRLLQVEARASQDARLKFRSGYSHLQTNYVNSSDLSIADPFS
uniref:FBD domain-containing protein n=1 Tax=Aegilops tauschii subsp. strangulata TaxID=200361 RepID=A0A452XTH8_AEGTS